MRPFLLLFWVSVSVLFTGPSTHALTRILVFPFEAENNVPRWAWLEQGLAAEIQLRLMRISSAEVSVNAESVPAKQTLRTAQAFGYHALVRGSFRMVGGFVEIRAEVVNMDAPDMVKAVTSRAPASQPLRALNELCTSLPVSTDTRLLRRESDVLAKPTTDSVPAFEAYVAGLSAERLLSDAAGTAESLIPAMLQFRKSAKIDPAFYGPHYQLGRLYESIGDRDKAVTAYRDALSRAPGIRPVEDRLKVLHGEAAPSS